MYEFDLPYDHKTMHLSLDEKNFAGLMQGHQNTDNGNRAIDEGYRRKCA